jgi:pSer/pThr/pTyr-binding forkhead associated (FHA) protein
MPKLVMKTGKTAGKSFGLSGPCILGRGDSAQVRVDDAKSSREHCRVFEQGGQWVVVDLNSRNGITINGVTKTRHTLRFGDEIAIGETIAVFQPRSGESAEDSKAQKSERMAPPEPSDAQKKAKAKRDKAFADARSKSGGGGGSKSATKGGGGSPKGDGSISVSDKVLQFNVQKNSTMGFDLSQMAFHQQFIVVVAALAVLGGIGYGLYVTFGSG